jgi:hypothetical protein
VACSRTSVVLLLWAAFGSSRMSVADVTVRPVTPDASPEAVALLNYLYSISGKGTLAGQHCVPLVGNGL